jgi:hypothetical protein
LRRKNDVLKNYSLSIDLFENELQNLKIGKDSSANSSFIQLAMIKNVHEKYNDQRIVEKMKSMEKSIFMVEETKMTAVDKMPFSKINSMGLSGGESEMNDTSGGPIAFDDGQHLDSSSALRVINEHKLFYDLTIGKLNDVLNSKDSKEISVEQNILHLSGDDEISDMRRFADAQEELTVGVLEVSTKQESDELPEIPLPGLKNQGLSAVSEVVDEGEVQQEPEELLDWRELAKAPEVGSAEVLAILNQNSDNELEKHLAIQILALRSGDVHLLDDWKWPVWKGLHKSNYSVQGSLRYPVGELSTLMNSSLYHLIKELIPIMIKVFKNRYSVDGLAKTMKMDPAEFMSKCQNIPLDHPVLVRSGLNLFSSEFKDNEIKINTFSGLGSYIFFDATKKTYFIDFDYYQTVPPSHLLHRVLFTLWAMKKQFFAIIHLDIHKEVYPMIKAIEKIVYRKGADKLKKIIGGSNSSIEKVFNQHDVEKITAAFHKAGPVMIGQLEELSNEMQLIINQLQLTDTLDFIGLAESICNRDLKNKPVQRDQILQIEPSLRKLISFSMKLNFDGVQDDVIDQAV